MKLIGHRGMKNRVCENTLESIYYAIEHNLDGVEIDIWKIASGQLIIYHDEDIYFNNQIVKINSLNKYDIENIDLIDQHNNKFKIPFLEDLLKNLKIINSNILINLEIKNIDVSIPLIDLLKQLFNQGIYYPERFLISSFILESLYPFENFQKNLFKANSHEFSKNFLKKDVLIFEKDVFKEKSFQKIKRSKYSENRFLLKIGYIFDEQSVVKNILDQVKILENNCSKGYIFKYFINFLVIHKSSINFDKYLIDKLYHNYDIYIYTINENLSEILNYDYISDKIKGIITDVPLQ